MKRGQWLFHTHTMINGFIHAECSECHKIRMIDSFCSNCGSIMNCGAIIDRPNENEKINEDMENES